MQTFTAEQRRTRITRRHGLAPAHRASSSLEAAERVVVLHATDPATVYLSVLARCPAASLDDVTTAMYVDKTLVKMIGMRRTMFVTPIELAPVVHSGAGVEIAARLRRQLVKQLQTLPTEQEIDDVEAWLSDVEESTEHAALARGEAFASELSEDEPRLRTAILPSTDKKWDVKRNITSQVLTLMAADGRLVRGRPGGTWLSRMHRWTPARGVWPGGMPEMPETDARAALATAWLRAFGPATMADLQWWTGWTAGTTRKVVAGIDTVDVDLDGVAGIVLADDAEPDAPVEPAAALLAALDPTPMGWQQRDFFLGPHRERLFDRNGNIGPTVWWDGRIVGGWGMKGPEIVWQLLEDVGADAESAIAKVASGLQDRLDSACVVPSFRTPLERELSS